MRTIQGHPFYNLNEQILNAARKKGLTIPVGDVKVRTEKGRKIAQKVVDLANEYHVLKTQNDIEKILKMQKGRISNLAKELQTPLKGKKF